MSISYDPRLDDSLPPVSRPKLLRALRRILPRRLILHRAEELAPYECDGLSAYQSLPLLVAIPQSEEQIQEILKTCYALGVPVVARGAGTGLSGGALPCATGLLLVLSKFDRILDVNPLARTATVQPGVRNLAISEAAEPHGLFFAPDPSSQIACSIGGNVAENAGGVHCLKYGLTVHNISKLRIMTMEGETITLGADALDAPGFDIMALLTGSEGLLGIIVEITVKLLPKPESIQVILASFGEVAKAATAVSNIISAGIVPAGLEMMDNPAIRAAEDFVQAGYPRDAAAILLCELDGNPADVAREIEEIKEILEGSGAVDVREARDEEERKRFWAGRKAAFPAVGRIAPDYYCMDGTVPRRHLARVLDTISQLSKDHGLRVANVFHAGDGNLHPLILYDANKAGELEQAERLGGKILELCVAVGGTITGEHGVGREKINQMCAQFTNKEILQFQDVKKAFDSKGLLNPGKNIPTLARCAEFGAMHVSGGKLLFPDLERF